MVMKARLLRFWITIVIMISMVILAACSSPGRMSYNEATKWIAAFTPEQINENSVIRIELTDSFREHIDTLRTLEGVFKFKPSIKGSPFYVHNGRFIDFIPDADELKQGELYECSINMAKLANIDSLKEFAFEFYVIKKETMFQDVKVYVNPTNTSSVTIKGSFMFSQPPGTLPTTKNLLRINNFDKPLASTFVETSDNKCYDFELKSIPRKDIDTEYTICFDGVNGFAPSETTFVVPALKHFKLFDAEMCSDGKPYINLFFSETLDSEQDLDGLITVEEIENIRLERDMTTVRAYLPPNGLTQFTLHVSELIRDINGNNLTGDIIIPLEQEVAAPAIDIPISGSILPDGKDLRFPFRTINLAAVDVEVVKIYTNNVMNFLQRDDIADTYHLRRAGRLIYRQTVRLDNDDKLNLHQWQNFSVDLRNLFKQEHGAIYNIRLSFRKAYSLYNRTKADDFEIQSGLTAKDSDTWDYDLSYISRDAPDYNSWNFNWRERDDPSKDSYYMVSYRMPEHNLVASNIGIIVKRADSNMIWTAVTDIMTAKPMSGICVKAYNFQLQEIGSAYTDENGFADFEIQNSPFIVTASNGVSTTYVKTTSGYELSTSSFNVDGKESNGGIKGFIYGERGVWRPGDDIFLTIIIEDSDKTLPQNQPVTLELYSPSGQLYSKQTSTKNVDGIYTFKCNTSEDAPTGHWQAVFKVGDRSFPHDVEIETIKPNRLKIGISAPEMLQAGESAQIVVGAKWLTGLTASGMNASAEMTLIGITNPFKQYRDYIFRNPLCDFAETEHDIFKTVLDSTGLAKKTYTLPYTKHAPGIMKANITARVEEGGGDMSLTSRMVTYSPYKSYVGIDLGNREFESGSRLHFHVVTVDPYGKPVNRKIHFRIYRLTWSYWHENTASALNKYIQSSAAEIIESDVVESQQGKFDITFTPDEWGKYLVYVEDIESGHATGGTIYVSHYTTDDSSFSNNASVLVFTLDKDCYEVGEYATICFPSFVQGEVLLSIENESKVITRRRVKAASDKRTFHRILVTKEMKPNFYVNAILLQPHGNTVNNLPIRMYGFERARVVDKSSILNPIITCPNEILPQKEFTIKVREENGKPMNYTLAIVDEGLLDITAYKTPQPWNSMNQIEGLGIRTWDMYNDVIGAYAGKYTQVLSVGGDETLRSAVGKEKRFNPVVMFLGPFTLDHGTKTHRITLPMYVGSVRVMVVAAKNGSYGNADKTVTVKSPLMLLSSLPRVLACGDRVKMPVNVFVTEDNIRNVNVNVKTEGPISIADTNMKSLSFSTQEEKITEFELMCSDTKCGKAKITITATGGRHSFTETIWIDVFNPLPDIISSENVILDADKEHTFNWEKFKDGQTTLSISKMPAIDFNGAFTFVKNYSHYCTEQLSARAMYMLYARRFLSNEEKLLSETALPALLKTLTSRQLYNGGFAYWDGNSVEHEWATSMAGEVMIEARRQGFSVYAQNIKKWISYQKEAARKYHHSMENAADLQQAYRLYTLALAGEPQTAAMNRLRESKNISAQALIRLAATYAVIGRTDIATKLISQSDSAPMVNGDYNTFWSPLRDKAMILEALVVCGEGSKALTNAQSMAKEFSATGCTTQEVAFVSAAMNRMANMFTAEPSNVTISEIGKTMKTLSGILNVTTLCVDPSSGTVTVRNNGRSTISLSLTTCRKPSSKEKVAPMSKGISIDVHYLDSNKIPISIGDIKQGDVFYAVIDVKRPGNHMTSVHDNDDNSMALTYALPAGWEILNGRYVDLNGMSSVNYTDVRDNRISWYFEFNSSYENRYAVKLRAAYEGCYLIPPTICEDMYDTTYRATTTSERIDVTK